MSHRTLAGCVVFLTPLVCAAQSTSPRTSAEIHIRIVQGDGAINSIRLHRGHDPVAQVLHNDGEPLSGATVTFLLPASGPGGVFERSGLSFTTQTDARGFAAARGLAPNRTPGPFRIRVVASWRGQAANASVSQTNADPVAASRKGRKIAILALIAGGIAGGAAAALAHGGGAGSTAAATGAAQGGPIPAGTPSIGPPH